MPQFFKTWSWEQFRIRTKKPKRTQHLFIFVAPGDEDNARLVVPDYFTFTLFGGREDLRLDDESAKQKASQIWRTFVTPSETCRPKIEFGDHFQLKGSMPIGVGGFRPVLLWLEETKEAPPSQFLQAAIKTQHGATVVNRIKPLERSHAARNFPQQLDEVRTRQIAG